MKKLDEDGPPRRRVGRSWLRLTGLVALLGLACYLPFALVTLRRLLFHPHSSSYASEPLDESQLVRSLLGSGTGQLAAVDLEAKVFIQRFDEDGQMMEWELLQSVNLGGLDPHGGDSWRSLELTLAPDHTRSLRNLTHPAELTAYLSLRPSTLDALPPSFQPLSFSHWTQGTIRKFSRYHGVDPAWLERFFLRPEDATPMDKMLDSMGTRVDLLVRQEWEAQVEVERTEAESRLDHLDRALGLPPRVKFETVQLVAEEDRKPPFLIARTWLIVSKDEPLYDLEAFKHRQQQLLIVENNCNDRRALDFSTEDLPCDKTFHRRGHFESLLEVEGARDGELSSWRYGPYLRGGVGLVGARDLVKLPDSLVDHFAFELKIDVSILSPAGLLRAEMREGVSPPWDGEEDSRSLHHDDASTTNAHLGHRLSPSDRILLRWTLGALGSLAYLISYILGLRYLFTRRLTSGIAYRAAALQLGSELVVGISLLLTEGVDDEALWFELSVQALELGVICWKWSRAGWRREKTRSEIGSEALDVSWVQHLFLVAGLTALLLLPSSLFTPPLLHRSSSPIELRSSALYSALHTALPAITQATALARLLLQARLNAKLSSFAGWSRLGAMLELFGAALSVTLLVGPTASAWAQFEAVQPLLLASVVDVATRAALVGQALFLPGVPQI